MTSCAALFVAGALAGLAPGPARAATNELWEYDITWIGVSVGTMVVQSATAADGSLLRSIRIRNRPWIALVYPVDNTVECRVADTPAGPRHTVTKKMGEKDFTQDDALTLWPATGQAIWTNAVSNAVHAFEVPRGSRDFVSFFFDLRDAAGPGPWPAQGDYQLVMDAGVHGLEIHAGPVETIRTPRGKRAARPVRVVSKSPALFTRNTPRAVWVDAEDPVVIYADVETRFGVVRGTLARWERDGRPVEWPGPAPESSRGRATDPPRAAGWDRPRAPGDW